VAERKRLNGYLIFDEGETCPHCGAVQHQSEADKENGDPPGYLLTCPQCYREGCEECMPSGRGCICPDCEDENDMEDNP